MHCIYGLCCGACIRIPYDLVGLDTGSSDPRNFARSIEGLINAPGLHRLVWAMKREKGEQIHSDLRDEFRFANRMNFGQSATNTRVNGIPPQSNE